MLRLETPRGRRRRSVLFLSLAGGSRPGAQRGGVEPAQRVVEPQLRFAGQLERRYAFGKRAEDRLAFEPRYRLPDTAMNAGAEGHVPGGAAPDVERIGPAPAARIAVGGGEKQQHLFAAPEPHAGDPTISGLAAHE